MYTSANPAVSARMSHALFRNMLDLLPMAAYVCDPQGLITYFNARVVEIWGRTPALNDEGDRYCGSYGVFSMEGVPIAPTESCMALAIKHRREYHGQAILVERPDGSRVPMLAYATALLDERGEVMAGITMLVDIDERDRWDRLLRRDGVSHSLSTLADGLRAELAVTRHTLDLLERTLAQSGEGPESLDIQLMRAGMREMSSLLEMLERPVQSPPAPPLRYAGRTAFTAE